ncbi:MAG: nitronate monooxygenase, partial [Pirellulales bacterium]
DSLLAQIKNLGAYVLASATNLEEAKWLEANGTDAIIAQGLEAGGHRGIFLNNDLSTQVATFELLKLIVVISKLPVIAAGGISTANDVSKASRTRRRRRKAPQPAKRTINAKASKAGGVSS